MDIPKQSIIKSQHSSFCLVGSWEEEGKKKEGISSPLAYPLPSLTNCFETTVAIFVTYAPPPISLIISNFFLFWIFQHDFPTNHSTELAPKRDQASPVASLIDTADFSIHAPLKPIVLPSWNLSKKALYDQLENPTQDRSNIH